MVAVVLNGVSPRSLGDLLKGYGVMALVGEGCPEREGCAAVGGGPNGVMAHVGKACPDALFWWDEGYHLVVELPSAVAADEEKARQMIKNWVERPLLEWGERISQPFMPHRGEKCNREIPCPYHGISGKKKGEDRCQGSSILLRTRHFYDEIPQELAKFARAVAVPLSSEAGSSTSLRKWRDETEPHPLFPGHGQEASGNYFNRVKDAVKDAPEASDNLTWSLFAEGNPTIKKKLKCGYLFFPEPMKRYATGIAKWNHEGDAPVSPWCFLLALRGAMLLRGSLRRLRWGRRSYPAFPFVFEGSVVEIGKGTFFRNVEIHLPTWNKDHPRTLAEFEMQIRQFQARLSGRGFAATAAEFRAAVVGRGTGAAFDTFHRFVLEWRRPGQQKPMPQGIPRGRTHVGRKGKQETILRLMLAPLAETGWFDQFITDRLCVARRRAEEAIHRAVDEPGLDAYLGILEALWELNRGLVLPGALRRDLEDRHQTPRPLPPLPAWLWECALEPALEHDPAHRLGRAIGSILGVRAERVAIGPILEHMLPVRFHWQKGAWTVPESFPSRCPRWAGLNPLADFRELFWYRWLESAELPRLPFGAARTASLNDVVALLCGEVNLRDVHRLAGLYALLDWWNEVSKSKAQKISLACSPNVFPVPPAYVALRLWLNLGISPKEDSRPPRDGNVARLLSLGGQAQITQAVDRALARLRVDGLPCFEEPRPTGKAVARFYPKVPDDGARMVVALLVPISEEDTRALARRLWVPADKNLRREFHGNLTINRRVQRVAL